MRDSLADLRRDTESLPDGQDRSDMLAALSELEADNRRLEAWQAEQSAARRTEAWKLAYALLLGAGFVVALVWFDDEEELLALPVFLLISFLSLFILRDKQRASTFTPAAEAGVYRAYGREIEVEEQKPASPLARTAESIWTVIFRIVHGLGALLFAGGVVFFLLLPDIRWQSAFFCALVSGWCVWRAVRRRD
jgi:hypothetical protein